VDFLTYLQCPGCSGELTLTEKKTSCVKCGATYPVIDGVPWLFSPPGETLAGWRVRFNALLASLQAEEEQLKAAQKQPRLSDLTTKRLRKQLQAKVEQRKLLSDLMSPLLKEPSGNPELYQAMQLRDLAGQSIGGYYTNIHRDWAWPTDENKICADIVSDLVHRCGDAKKFLILGAGAGRLAWDIHQRHKPEITVALDINPLMILAARKVTKGRNLKLYEFPLAPKDADSTAVLQTCRSPEETPDNLHFILADGLTPPVRPGAFDLILTPWFIDIIPTTLPETASVINNLLGVGGHWINFGSLAFNHGDPAANYSPEETVETVNSSGFFAGHVIRHKIPYMQSPHSAHGRIEETFSFQATKASQVALKRPAESEAAWLRDFSQPIPQDRVFTTTGMVYSIYLEVVSRIDGRTSVNDIARDFGPKHGLPPDEAAVSVKNFLVRMRDSASRGSNF
jgi:hypothetical protein